MSITRPGSDQLQFQSSKTGTHILDDYLEAAERGDRPLYDLMADLFDTSGNFNADLIEFRVNTSTQLLEVRLGSYVDPEEGWNDASAYFFRVRGDHANATAYKRLDVVGYSNSLYVCTADHTSASSSPGGSFYKVIDAASLVGVRTFNTRTGDVTLSSSDVTTALGYTPTSITGLTGTQSTAAIKTGLSLNNVDNTSDADKPISTATQTALDAKEPLGAYSAINTQTASYALVLADASKLVVMNVGSANNLTIPLNATVAFPLKTRIDIFQYGAGQTTIVPTGGVTMRSSGSRTKLSGQYSGGSLVKIGTDEWLLVGDIAV